MKYNKPLTCVELEEWLCSEWEDTLIMMVKDYAISTALLRRVRDSYKDYSDIVKLCNEIVTLQEEIILSTKAEIELERKQLKAIQESKYDGDQEEIIG